jgi:hypothetical protein
VYSRYNGERDNNVPWSGRDPGKCDEEAAVKEDMEGAKML